MVEIIPSYVVSCEVDAQHKTCKCLFKKLITKPRHIQNCFESRPKSLDSPSSSSLSSRKTSAMTAMPVTYFQMRFIKSEIQSEKVESGTVKCTFEMGAFVRSVRTS